MISLIVMIFITGCHNPKPNTIYYCPNFPKVEKEVTIKLKTMDDEQIDKFFNDLVKLKKKLDYCKSVEKIVDELPDKKKK